MAQAAVPQYVTTAGGFADCAPGHRFNLYFEIWQEGWSVDKTKKADALRKTLSCHPVAGLLEGMRSRQQTLAEALPEDCCHVVEARSTSPFSSGLGLEHPVENGFAFLSPYGLAYLAGSGVKGVLRKAAEELRDDGSAEISSAVIDVLFGHESDTAARRGALAFWDVFPKSAKESLTVEIMTPHYGGYYQNGGTPHDARKPNPIPFLAVPAGSDFRFVITCEPGLLGDAVDHAQWKELLDKIMRHAFAWLGFGAKTSVGYGAMEQLSAVEISDARAQTDSAAKRCDWVDQNIEILSAQNKAKPSDTLRGKGLAEAWKLISDATLKARAKADIKARWQAEGWWDNPPGKASRQAKAIYMENKAE